MDWKRYWNEMISSIGTISVIYLFIQLSSRRIFENFEIGLLRIYIITAFFVFLNYHLFPKIIKNFRERRKLFYIVVIIDATVLFTLTDIIFTIINLQGKKISTIFITLPFLFLAFVITYIIVYYTQNAYYKRVNKKLNEYKQKNDDDNTDK